MTKSRNIIQRHGLRHHPLYKVWIGIKTRCYNPNSEAYEDYGGRGVQLCPEWLKDFKAFYDWCIANGWRKGLDIDKDIKAKEMGVEPNLYSPERCQFVSRKKNSNTRRNSDYVMLNGIEITLTEACEKLGKNYCNIYTLINRNGYSFGEAIKHDKKNVAFGERCRHKLTQEQVDEIRRLYVPRIFSTRKLAGMYNVTQAAICLILKGKNWKQSA